MFRVKRMIFRESLKIKGKKDLVYAEEFYTDYMSYDELKGVCADDSKEEMAKITRGLYGSLPAGSVRGGYLGIFSIKPLEYMEDLLLKINDGYKINENNDIYIRYSYSVKTEDGSKLEDNYTIRYSFHAI